MNTGNTAAGYIFTTQQKPTGITAPTGPVIMDDHGRPIWFLPLTTGVAADFRVQTYHGNPVLTWAQGVKFQDPNPDGGTDYIYDTSYNLVATVHAGNGYNADLHEFEITPQDTALITIYHQVTMDLTPYGGVPNTPVLEGIAQEIDIATGAVLFEWHSLDHVSFDESNLPVPTTASAYDYFHINSVKLDTDGNYVISARHTSTVYKVDRSTGDIIWRLGGKKSDFALGAGLPFAWQHNATAVDDHTIRVFDNESNGIPSRALWVQYDTSAMTASVSRAIQHPAGLATVAEGDVQDLSNGDVMVGWGSLGGFSEFDSSGNLVLDVRQARGFSNYRTYRFPWTGHPTTSPSADPRNNPDGTITVHAIWNGATEVANWKVLGSTNSEPLSQIATAPWNGLDTPITVSGGLTSLQVVALDAAGNTLGSSTVATGPFLEAPPVFTAQPNPQTIAVGSTVVFSSEVTGAMSYQWSYNGTNLTNGTNAGVTFLGATSPTLMIRGVAPASAGRYVCTATNSGGSVASSIATLAVSTTTDIGRLINLSCRSVVAGGDNNMIVGFVVGGQGTTGTLNVFARASGPALQTFGVTDTLPDPRLDLYDSSSATVPILSATAWKGDSAIATMAQTVDAFPWADPASSDAALIRAMPAGPYTVVVSSLSGQTGVALAEAYDATAPGAFTASTPHLINGSGRAQVGSGSDILIAGFVIGGGTARTVLVRAAGPSLGAFGVAHPLSDPLLQVFTSSGTVIATNSGWDGNPQIAAAASAVGAFPWTDPTSYDSAVLVTLPPGAYTAQVSGLTDDTGVALAEVYEVP